MRRNFDKLWRSARARAYVCACEGKQRGINSHVPSQGKPMINEPEHFGRNRFARNDKHNELKLNHSECELDLQWMMRPPIAFVHVGQTNTYSHMTKPLICASGN